MERIAWATDLHLNFAGLSQWDRFIRQANTCDCQAIVVSGDISESEDLTWNLQRIKTEVNLPIYFVLGNHDFYHGGIDAVRRDVGNLCLNDSGFTYLTDHAPVQLNDHWALCGEDGWGDGRDGDCFQTPVRLNDFQLIEDFRDLDLAGRYRKIRRQGAASALRLGRQLEQAAPLAPNILVVTHVPPFRESCWYEGNVSDDNWAPFFVCKSTGWALRRFCLAHPNHSVLVLCGHTHHGGCAQILSNLVVWTGAAEYGEPEISEVLELGADWGSDVSVIRTERSRWCE